MTADPSPEQKARELLESTPHGHCAGWKNSLNMPNGLDCNCDWVIRAIISSRTIAIEGCAAWQPIETAPKDGSKIDLWFHDDERSCRIADAYWSGTLKRGWWWAPGYDYEGADGEIPRSLDVTHWMPLPAPPASVVPQADAQPESAHG